MKKARKSEQMNKRIIILMCLGILLFAGCSSKKEVNGDKLFPENYFDNVKYVQYYAPDETITIVDEPKVLKQIWDALRDNSYEEYEGEALIGGYDFRLIYADKVTYIMLDNSHFSIDGKWYNCKKPLADLIFEYSGIK